MKPFLPLIVMPGLAGVLLLSGCEQRMPKAEDMSTSRTPTESPGTGAPGGTQNGTTASPGADITGSTGNTTGSQTAGNVGDMGGGGTASGAVDPATGSNSGVARTPGAGTSRVAAADRTFMETAARSNIAEIEASRIAAERASSDTVKDYAETMMRDHTNLDQELHELAIRKGITLPNQPSVAGNTELDRLRAARGEEFDRLYVNRVGSAAHKEAVELFERAATIASDPDVKAYAARGLPALRAHLSKANALLQTTPAKG